MKSNSIAVNWIDWISLMIAGFVWFASHSASKHKHVIITVNFMKSFWNEVEEWWNKMRNWLGGGWISETEGRLWWRGIQFRNQTTTANKPSQFALIRFCFLGLLPADWFQNIHEINCSAKPEIRNQYRKQLIGNQLEAECSKSKRADCGWRLTSAFHLLV